MSNQQALELCETWLDHVAKRPRQWGLIELPGFLPGIERLGGRQALARILAAIEGL